jgi:hypothetical protein
VPNSTSTSFVGENLEGNFIGNTYISYSGSTLLSVVDGSLCMRSALQFQTNHINIQALQTPTTSAATGAIGVHAWDASYLCVCVATNTRKRAAISTW